MIKRYRISVILVGLKKLSDLSDEHSIGEVINVTAVVYNCYIRYRTFDIENISISSF